METRRDKPFYGLNETKAAVSESISKTIKSRLTKYMIRLQTHVLGHATDSYNNTYHNSIKKAPANVKAKDEAELWQFRYNTDQKAIQCSTSTSARFRCNNVRISYLHRPFQREYDKRWALEYFDVSKRGRKLGIPLYKLKGLHG